MTSTGRVRVPGLGRFLGDLRAARDAITDTTGPDTEAAEEVADRVRDAAPVRTGRLRASTRIHRAKVAVEAPYAAYVEARAPFAGPAVDAAAPAVEGIYTEHVTHALTANLSTHY